MGNLTLSIDESVIAEARRRASVLGKSVNQLVREYLEEFAGKRERAAEADHFLKLTSRAPGKSRGWRWNREEIHERG